MHILIIRQGHPHHPSTHPIYIYIYTFKYIYNVHSLSSIPVGLTNWNSPSWSGKCTTPATERTAAHGETAPPGYPASCGATAAALGPRPKAESRSGQLWPPVPRALDPSPANSNTGARPVWKVPGINTATKPNLGECRDTFTFLYDIHLGLFSSIEVFIESS